MTTSIRTKLSKEQISELRLFAASKEVTIEQIYFGNFLHGNDQLELTKKIGGKVPYPPEVTFEFESYLLESVADAGFAKELARHSGPLTGVSYNNQPAEIVCHEWRGADQDSDLRIHLSFDNDAALLGKVKDAVEFLSKIKRLDFSVTLAVELIGESPLSEAQRDHLPADARYPEGV